MKRYFDLQNLYAEQYLIPNLSMIFASKTRVHNESRLEKGVNQSLILSEIKCLRELLD